MGSPAPEAPKGAKFGTQPGSGSGSGRTSRELMTGGLSNPVTRIGSGAWPLLLVAAGLAGGSMAVPRAGADELLVGAAISVRQPLLEIAARYGVERPGARVRLTFGATSSLAAQVRAGAPIDVLVSADERIVDELERRGFVAREGRREFALNRLVVLVAADLEISVDRPENLDRPEVKRIAIPEVAVPVGRYAREWLASRGLLKKLEGRIVPTAHARATLAAVDHGQVDVAIVYATDARLSRAARVAFEVPEAEQPRIAYVAARVTNSQHRELANDFLAYLGNQATEAVLRRAGFTVPEDPP